MSSDRAASEGQNISQTSSHILILYCWAAFMIAFFMFALWLASMPARCALLGNRLGHGDTHSQPLRFLQLLLCFYWRTWNYFFLRRLQRVYRKISLWAVCLVKHRRYTFQILYYLFVSRWNSHFAIIWLCVIFDLERVRPLRGSLDLMNPMGTLDSINLTAENRMVIHQWLCQSSHSSVLCTRIAIVVYKSVCS